MAKALLYIFRFVLRLKPILASRNWENLKPLLWRSFWRSEQLALESRLPGTQLSTGCERTTLIEALVESYPFHSVLEVGCAYGQNFHILGKLLPWVLCLGVDHDKTCIEQGNDLLQLEGFKNTHLEQREATELLGIADKSWDVVLSSGFLLNISPEQIEVVASELIRVCRKRLFFLELHSETDQEGMGLKRFRVADGSVFWVRNYLALLRRHLPDGRYRLLKVENALWKSEDWAQLGYVIEVDLGTGERAANAQ